MKSKKLVIGLAALAIFGFLGFKNVKQSLTPYVSFAEARTLGRTVQVAGFPDHAASRFDGELGGFRFTMANEDGDVMPVVYKGGKPGNFDQATSVVVVGDCTEGVMHAKQILVKCPSKYEAEGTEHPGEAGTTAPAEAAPTTSTPTNNGY